MKRLLNRKPRGQGWSPSQGVFLVQWDKRDDAAKVRRVLSLAWLMLRQMIGWAAVFFLFGFLAQLAGALHTMWGLVR